MGFFLYSAAPKFLPDSSVSGSDRVAYFLELMQPIRVDQITYGSACHRRHTQDCNLPGFLTVDFVTSKYGSTKNRPNNFVINIKS